jgi:hypothetical protein
VVKTTQKEHEKKHDFHGRMIQKKKLRTKTKHTKNETIERREWVRKENVWTWEGHKYSG